MSSQTETTSTSTALVPQRCEHTHRFLRGTGVWVCCLRGAGGPHTCQPSSNIASFPSFHVFGTASETLWSRRLTWSSDHRCCWPWRRKYRDTVLHRPNWTHRANLSVHRIAWHGDVLWRCKPKRWSERGEGISPKIDKMAATKRSLSKNLTGMKVLFVFFSL